MNPGLLLLLFIITLLFFGQTQFSQIYCPPIRSPGGVTFGPTDFGTPNSLSQIDPVPPCRHFTYNTTLTSLIPGQAPANQDNCYQFPCPEGFQSTDMCWRCGDKPYAGPPSQSVNCLPPQSACQLLM